MIFHIHAWRMAGFYFNGDPYSNFGSGEILSCRCGATKTKDDGFFDAAKHQRLEQSRKFDALVPEAQKTHLRYNNLKETA